MATLTETAYYTRRTINWVILAIIFYIILRLTWSIVLAIWLVIFPPQAPPPNHRFGKLPALVFPEQATPSGQLTFQLQTIQGSVPKASDSAMVYFMPKQAANLLALTNTEEFAKRMDFDPAPIAESKNLYRFDDPDLPLRKLRYDIVSSNFIVRYNFEQDTGLFNEKNIPQVDEARQESIATMQNFNLWVDDIKAGTSTVTFLKLVSDHFVPTTSLSVADSVRVDFFRQAIGDMKVLTPNPDEGQISFIYSGSTNSKKKILQFAYTFWPIDRETTATYALKPSSLAWQELQSGAGFIARYPTAGTTAVVRQVYLAYYDSYQPQTYLQPIFVFEGDLGFLGYVPAVDREWVE